VTATCDVGGGSRAIVDRRVPLSAMTDQELSDTQTIDPGSDGADPRVVDSHTAVAEAISVIDAALGRMLQRDLVATGEVADLLLDLRTLLTTV
jgi:hypothetical protein